MSYTAIGTRTHSSPVTAKQYGAVGDGSSHPLSGYFTTLGAAQAAYPNAGVTGLTQEIDGAAIQQLLHDQTAPLIEPGTYLTSFGLVSTQTGLISGYGATIRAVAAGISYMLDLQGYAGDAAGLTVDGGVYSHSVNPTIKVNGDLGLNGASYGFRISNCSRARFADLVALNCASYGYYADSPSLNANFCSFDGCQARACGILDVWSLAISGGASGTFTITVQDRFGGSHTTGNITIGTTTIGAAQAYNISNLPNNGASNAALTMEGIIGTAIHNPGASPATYGFGSKTAESSIVDSTSYSGALATGRGTVIAAGGTYYLICQGDLLGPGPLAGGNFVVSATNPSGGGTVTLNHVQAGVKGGGIGCGSTNNNNFYLWNKPVMRSNYGDGALLAGMTTWILNNGDYENCFGSAVRIEGTTGGTTALSHIVERGDFESCWAPFILEKSSGGPHAGCTKNTFSGDPTHTLNDAVIGGGASTVGYYVDGTQITLAAG